MIPNTNGLGGQIGLFRYTNRSVISNGDVWCLGSNVFECGQANFGIGTANLNNVIQVDATTGTILCQYGITAPLKSKGSSQYGQLHLISGNDNNGAQLTFFRNNSAVVSNNGDAWVIGTNRFGNGDSSKFGIGTTNIGNVLTVDATSGLVSINSLNTNTLTINGVSVATSTNINNINSTFLIVFNNISTANTNLSNNISNINSTFLSVFNNISTTNTNLYNNISYVNNTIFML